MAAAKILAVDDDPKILKILRHCLEKEGFQVAAAADGEAAVKAAKLDRPDLVILDLMLPKLNGLDVCKRLSAEAEDLPIIILSAKGDELDRIVGLRMGVDDYVAKPFSPTELVLRVRAVLRRANRSQARPEENPIACGDITIDSRTRTVTVRSQPVILTGKEFDMLFLLMSHSQQVFTRIQLLNKIWHSDYQGDENTVTVHIRRLREKIEPDPSQPCYIQTVWGVGYKFSCSGT
ncbi:response regulator transcription factor [Acetonema longum]|uniref:Two component transcriptional regulator, winged helix family protein n=1 Tax=Acetonema longum DSM 6540 TaxID=1009370 RepID=F7NFH6_9FIRM|nr:response regulator transcription factor [Acetonema longum]EGO65231.1 two component transcriptional regulator, winged helix family protein [Acetonema longum DSM 6540]